MDEGRTFIAIILVAFFSFLSTSQKITREWYYVIIHRNAISYLHDYIMYCHTVRNNVNAVLRIVPISVAALNVTIKSLCVKIPRCVQQQCSWYACHEPFTSRRCLHSTVICIFYIMRGTIRIVLIKLMIEPPKLSKVIRLNWKILKIYLFEKYYWTAETM